MPTLNLKSPRRPWQPERKPFERRKRGNQAVYQSKRWKQTRQIVLSRDNFCCVECEKEGLVEPATVVDHIVAINQGGSVFGLDNLQSLCSMHHNRKSGGEAHVKTVL